MAKFNFNDPIVQALLDASEARNLRQSRSIPGDRAQMAFYHALHGDGDLAFRAMLDPASLAPGQHKELAETVWPRKVIDERGPTHLLKRLATNPLMWLGLVLGVKFGGGGIKAIQRYTTQVATEYNRYSGPIERLLLGGWQMLETAGGKATRFKRLLLDFAMMKDKLRSRRGSWLMDALVDYETRTGKAISPASEIRVLAAMEHGFDPKTGVVAKRLPTIWEKINKAVGGDFGFKPITLTSDEIEYARALHKVRLNVFQEILSGASGDDLVKFSKAMKQAGLADDLATVLPSKEQMHRYVPHMPHVTRDTIQKEVFAKLAELETNPNAFIEALEIANPMSEFTRLAKMEELAFTQAGKLPTALKKRRHLMVPAIEHLKAVEGDLKAGTIDAVENYLKQVSKDKGVIVRQYSLHAGKVFSSYIENTAQFQAWVKSGLGHKLLNEELPKIMKQNPALGQMVQETIIPLARGSISSAEFARRSTWEIQKLKWVHTLRTHSVFKNGLGKEVGSWLEKALLQRSVLARPNDAEAMFMNLLYSSTLGGNLGPTFANSMQTLGTTIPILGYQNTMSGFLTTVKRLAKYANNRFVKRMTPDRAARAAFPEFVSAGIDRPELYGEAFNRALDEAYGRATAVARPTLKRAWRRVNSFLMMPFMQTERFNRLVSFYGGYNPARRGGLALKDAVQVGRQVVEETQFMVGPLSRPTWTNWIPAPFRMFSQFPLRMGGLYYDAAKRALTGRDPSAWGTLGRAYVAGETAREAFYELPPDAVGPVDVSRGLAWEGLPIGNKPRDFPLLGSPMVTLATSPFTEQGFLGAGLPLLVPGGVAIGRAAALARPEIGRMMGRRYVDWKEDADGRVTMYTDKGQKIGRFTKAEVTASALGFQTGKVFKERETSAYLKKFARDVQGLRRRVQEGYANNNMTEVRKAVKEWDKRFPNVPFPIKDSDLRAIRDRRMLMRSEVLMRQIPVEQRQEFGGILSAVLAGRAPVYFSSSDVTPPPIYDMIKARLQPQVGMSWGNVY